MFSLKLKLRIFLVIMSNRPLLVQEKDSNSVKDKELMEFSLRLMLLFRIS